MLVLALCLVVNVFMMVLCAHVEITVIKLSLGVDISYDHKQTIRHTVSTGYSLTFCVHVMLPERHQ